MMAGNQTWQFQRSGVRRFLQTERVLKRKGSWNQFRLAVKEYFVMDHGEVVPDTDLTRPEGDCYFLPMHGVVKESSSTTKLRIVFDVSALTTSGNSLNDSYPWSMYVSSHTRSTHQIQDTQGCYDC